MKISLLLFLIILSSCSSEMRSKDSKVEFFFVQWSGDFYTEQPDYQFEYKIYLQKAEKIFFSKNVHHKFDDYLASSTNFFQLMAHGDYNIPYLYKRLKGSRANLNTHAYKQFRDRNLYLNFQKLSAEREKNLISTLGAKFIEDLKELNIKSPQFPL